MTNIYLDHAATTPVHPQVIEAMVPVYQEVFGNPSSVHQFGRKARRILDEARRTMADSIHCNEKEVIFTGSGTEADNMAIIGAARANREKGNHIITTAIEHHAVLHAAEQLKKEGFIVTYLEPDVNGRITAEDVADALTEETIVVSVMMVNNETGVIQPIPEIGEIVSSHQAYFHTDAVQAFGTMPIDVNELQVDLLAVSAHKINGPKGVGFLYAKEGTILETLHHGGEQERKRRPGTENLPGVKGFEAAVQMVMQEKEDRQDAYRLYKNIFLDILRKEEIEFSINGDPEKSVDTIINISFTGTNVEALLTNFDLAGVAASSGSACTAGSVEPSHVLSAMYGSEDERVYNSIRFSFGLANNEANVKEAAENVCKIVNRLKR
ncbi:cysteine desulfurase family protein [Thalassobacillus pellis]|uniref:cysteine desulfurase family protein n=1 Tax=Thalassobacillus pellis TaxID=748008 RepID=UPI00195F51D2|nr:cysteine desulfurase family protein [Thalassobacillus pellis]MBM7554662.1 cysteine desulfurase [Thalassobacillus pellis]